MIPADNHERPAVVVVKVPEAQMAYRTNFIVLTWRHRKRIALRMNLAVANQASLFLRHGVLGLVVLMGLS